MFGEALGQRAASGDPRLAAAPVRTATGRGQTPQAVLEQVIERVAAVVERETASLKSGGPVDFRDFNARKSQGLYELDLALRPFASNRLEGPLLVKLAELRSKLEENRARLKLHMDAAREIAALLADVIREHESDGTYTAAILHNGAGR